METYPDNQTIWEYGTGSFAAFGFSVLYVATGIQKWAITTTVDLKEVQQGADGPVHSKSKKIL